ncbi:hypothetical protein N7454_011118 [Penicillium verhagenii]|nr:hypothetical protein N7454_011118 [Penicillium verhagenii]
MASLPSGDKDNGAPPPKLPSSTPDEKDDSLSSDKGGDERKKRRYGLICATHANRETTPATQFVSHFLAHSFIDEEANVVTRGQFCTERDCSFHPNDGNKPAWAQWEFALEEWVRQQAAVSSAQAQPDNVEPENRQDEETQSDKEH